MILILSFVVIVVLFLMYGWLRNNRIRNKQFKDFEDVFSQSGAKLPVLDFSSSYSWPTFTITFETKEDMELAEHNGQVDEFKKRMKSYYDSAFDPDRAIVSRYKDWLHDTMDAISKKTLEEIVNKYSAGNNITPEVAIDSMLDFYKNNRAHNHNGNNDDDMLLFQYGIYDWDGTGQKFELNLTRQMADTDDEYNQVRLIIYYSIEEIGDVGNFNLWSTDLPDMEQWKKVIMHTEGFKRASSAKAIDYKVELINTN
ncbi:MAG: hypothetical protein HOP30_08265 [Cyclobacteriaceae bacterium]|nr:hypothetical protein [Cyclobacteriaceae bacterium]